MTSTFWSRLSIVFVLFHLLHVFVVRPVEAVVSAECEHETKVIQSYSNVQAELHLALHKHVQGHVLDCNYTSMTEFNCTITYDPQEETMAPYQEFCDRAQGQIVKRKVDLNHVLLGVLTFNVAIKDIPQCVGASCDPSTIEQDDLPNDIFGDFIKEMSEGDICDQATASWGELDFWGNFGVQIASWAGVDLRDCFDDPEDDENN
ncbi:expressed unknown protein [Seminavis robusta]|uniref:Secreted protein n=1 Tax=Seminavis robusta TaxID=568900 RepID=A0A9N8EI35_9STRA|nr:expressed unknown protein [Seminavis robusta]|eukprot:Sro1258_g256840.1 n/a (204) ;mRNA; r:21862-22473